MHALPQTAPDASRNQRRSGTTGWALIVGFGAAGWFITTLCSILWLWPKSGTMVGEQYFLSTPARIVQYTLVFLLALIAYRYIFSRRFPRFARHRGRYVALHLLLAALVMRAAPLATGIVTALIDGYRDEGAAILQYWRPLSLPLAAWSSVLQFFLPPYLLGLTLIAVANAVHAHHRQSLRAAQLAAAYSDAQLAMLSARLQPHFLLNALNAVSELIIQDPKLAQVVVARLGQFLRNALDSSKSPWSSIDREIDSVRCYLAIQRARFGEELQSTLEIEEGAERHKVPSMVLQPLVENAVEHGRQGQQGPLEVTVLVRRSADRLRIVITNNAPQLSRPLDPREFGNGLSNVALRIQAAYGGAASLQVGPAERGTAAVLELPCADSVAAPIRSADYREAVT